VTSNIFSVPTISCEHCVDAITTEVAALDDVVTVDVDLVAKTVRVDGGTTNEVIAAIDEAGYEASLL